VQIPIEEFERLEEAIENYGLSKLIDEVGDDESLVVRQDMELSYRQMAKDKGREEKSLEWAEGAFKSIAHENSGKSGREEKETSQ